MRLSVICLKPYDCKDSCNKLKHYEKKCLKCESSEWSIESYGYACDRGFNWHGWNDEELTKFFIDRGILK